MLLFFGSCRFTGTCVAAQSRPITLRQTCMIDAPPLPLLSCRFVADSIVGRQSRKINQISTRLKNKKVRELLSDFFFFLLGCLEATTKKKGGGGGEKKKNAFWNVLMSVPHALVRTAVSEQQSTPDLQCLSRVAVLSVSSAASWVMLSCYRVPYGPLGTGYRVVGHWGCRGGQGEQQDQAARDSCRVPGAGRGKVN